MARKPRNHIACLGNFYTHSKHKTKKNVETRFNAEGKSSEHLERADFYPKTFKANLNFIDVRSFKGTFINYEFN